MTVQSHKRKRSAPLTPPLSANDSDSVDVLSKALHILSSETAALSHVTRLYQTSEVAKDGLLRAFKCIIEVYRAGGKLIVCGVGKSGLVGMKTVATMKSLGLPCSFMHAGEAIHGDLGDVMERDAILFVSYSGKTAELLAVLPHLSRDVPILVMTSHLESGECELLIRRPDGILLPSPIHESEEKSFGVSAPTTSATVAIAMGDMLALTVADHLHSLQTSQVFKKNHPGGAIGDIDRAATNNPQKKAQLLRDIGVALEDIPRVQVSDATVSALDVHVTAANSPSGWVRIGDKRIMRPRDIKQLRRDEQVANYSHRISSLHVYPLEQTLTEAAKQASSLSERKQLAGVGHSPSQDLVIFDYDDLMKAT